MLKYSKAKELIKKFEGCKLKAYKCPAGVWTIGYGHTKNVKPNDIITPEQAEKLLEEDLKEIEWQISKLGLELTENQYNAIMSLIFNIGIGRFAASTMYKLLLKKRYEEAGEEFTKWCYSNGKILKGLQRRREAERELYFSKN